MFASYPDGSASGFLIKEAVNSISIRSDFYKWAIEAVKYLHRTEIHEQESIVTQNRKRENELLNKLDSLVMMRAGNEITAEQLARMTKDVEVDLKDVRDNIKSLHIRAIDWVTIADKYLTFALTAKDKFESGDENEKKIILNFLGSNLTLKDQKLQYTAISPLQGIRSTYILATSLNTPLEPKIPQLKQGYLGELDPHNSVLLKVWNDVRTNLH